ALTRRGVDAWVFGNDATSFVPVYITLWLRVEGCSHAHNFSLISCADQRHNRVSEAVDRFCVESQPHANFLSRQSPDDTFHDWSRAGRQRTEPRTQLLQLHSTAHSLAILLHRVSDAGEKPRFVARLFYKIERPCFDSRHGHIDIAMARDQHNRPV